MSARDTCVVTLGVVRSELLPFVRMSISRTEIGLQDEGKNDGRQVGPDKTVEPLLTQILLAFEVRTKRMKAEGRKWIGLSLATGASSNRVED